MSSPGPALKGSIRGGVALATGVAVLAAMPATAQSAAPVTAAQVDPIFATFNSDTAPGWQQTYRRAGSVQWRVLDRTTFSRTGFGGWYWPSGAADERAVW